MTITQAPAAPFNTAGHIEAAAKLTPAESKSLGSVKGRIDEMNAISERSARPRLGMAHPLDMEIHAASMALTESPSAEAAERLHALTVRKRDAELSARPISAAIKQAVRREVEKLTPIALRILDDAEAAFLAEAEQHRKATATQTTFAAAAADFDSRLEATRAAFAEKRRWVSEEGAAAHFLLLELALGVA